MKEPSEKDDMTKEDRQRLVLRFLADHGLALPPMVIWRNLRIHQRLTVEDTTIENYLDEFIEEGWVRRVDPEAMARYEIVDLGDDTDRRAYYVITEEGREWLNES